ncbi:MAG: lipoyl(octanoyl) transferase LipB [Candidatus Malihini olakiniferum]
MTFLEDKIIVRQLGVQPYRPVSLAMHRFTDLRNSQSADELWLVQHPPIFTQGQTAKIEHLRATGEIPIIQSDRGGQVTYHGPGQQVIYVLVDLKRRKVSVRELVTVIEKTVIGTLAEFGIVTYARADAPGVYVQNSKICSLGLRIRKGCSFHGLALNIKMDLTPFLRINPCGYEGLKMTQVSTLAPGVDVADITPILIATFMQQLRYTQQASFIWDWATQGAPTPHTINA